ncbi:MAG: adenylate/guanylate cyclase domain-containing protein [Desulfovibrionaceae bacterium]|nr:adenylate/guanylate cyclase domain-containing protein [Desulfovibrionaceae bacterium]MBF0513501.1 adenylate/guanylate cyclase domain-containing protein [Desulfovibrionaceae bacterium]
MAAFSFHSVWSALKEYFKGRFGIFLAGAAITAGMALLYAIQPTWMESQDNMIYDFLLRSRGSTPVSGQVVLVDIDEKSLAKLGQWPWPRYRLTLLLGQMRQAGARAVAMDMLLAEPDRTSPVLLERQFKDELNFDVSFSGLPDPFRDNDQVLAKMLSRGPFVLSYYFDFSGTGEKSACRLPASPFSVAGRQGAVAPAEAAMNASNVLCPLPVLLDSATAAGFMNTIPDSDNVIRRLPLVIAYNGAVYPSLALAAAMRGLGATGRELAGAEAGLKSLKLSGPFGEKTIPLDARGMLLLNYRGRGGIYPRLSACDVLSGEVDKSALEGKTVIFGSTAVGMQDIRATPLDRATPGAEIQATVVDMILTNDYILRPDWAPALEFCLVLAMGLLSAVLLSRAKGLWLIATLAGLGLAMWFGAAQTLKTHKLFIQPLYPLAVLLLNFVLLTVFKFWREERQRRFIHSAFAHYLSPKVVDQIVQSPDKLNLTGEEREISILFSDIRGFTSISEKLSPTQLVDLLHEYLTPMTHTITEHLGTLDKYIGDAIMAFWNAPLDVANHRAEALAAGLDMIERLGELNTVFAAKYGQTLKVGVGLNCGFVRVGNFGSQDLFSYTIIGDNVNLCSRLEGLTKYYGLTLVAGEGMVHPSTAGFHFQEVDSVLVKGKHEPVTIYSVMHPAERDRRAEELDLAGKALARYKSRDFAASLASFTDLETRFGARLYSLYKERCQTLIATPPPAEWNGVFEHLTK